MSWGEIQSLCVVGWLNADNWTILIYPVSQLVCTYCRSQRVSEFHKFKWSCSQMQQTNAACPPIYDLMPHHLQVTSEASLLFIIQMQNIINCILYIYLLTTVTTLGEHVDPTPSVFFHQILLSKPEAIQMQLTLIIHITHTLICPLWWLEVLITPIK